MNSTTRQERAYRVLEQFRVDEHDHVDEDVVGNAAEGPSRFLLVEKSRYDSTHYFTSHDSAEAACTYVNGQEYPEDWHPQALVDLDEGHRWEVFITAAAAQAEPWDFDKEEFLG